MVPFVTIPGGNPTTAVPGLTPRLPLTVVTPVLVTVVPARTANDAAVPRFTGAGPAPAMPPPAKTAASAETTTMATAGA